MIPENEFNELTVPDDTPPVRIDIWLARNVPDLSRRRAATLLQSGEIFVNGRPVAKSALIQGGQHIQLRLRDSASRWTATPCPDQPLTVLYEDEAIVVVDKPSGLPSVPLHREDVPTLAGAIAARYPECAPLGRHNGDTGLIGRLDTETSGLLIAARSTPAFDRLMKLQREEQIVKAYLALTRKSASLPPVIRAPLEACGRNAHRVRVAREGEDCVTQVETVQEGSLTLLRAIITKGFRHQIRVHLASCGAHIAGDELYDGPKLPGLSRLFLHSAEVSLPHPITGKPLRIACPLPEELTAVLNDR